MTNKSSKNNCRYPNKSFMDKIHELFMGKERIGSIRFKNVYKFIFICVTRFSFFKVKLLIIIYVKVYQVIGRNDWDLFYPYSILTSKMMRFDV